MDEQEILNAAAQAANVEAPQAPAVEIPQAPVFEAPKAPEFTAPLQPQYQPPQYQPQPQYQAPQYQAPQQPQYQAPQYQQPQYQAPQYPQYQQPQYQQPQYRAPQYQPAPAAAPAKGSKVGNIMGIIGFACSMLAVLLGFIGIAKLSGSIFELKSALSLWIWSLVFCIPGLVCGIIGLAKKGKKGFALTAVIVSAILLLLAIIFIAVIAEEVSSYRYYW